MKVGEKHEGLPFKKARLYVETINFSDADLVRLAFSHKDALVITLRVDKFDVRRILVDSGC